MNKFLISILLATTGLSQLQADLFYHGRIYDAATKTQSENPDVMVALKDALGSDPSYTYTPNWEGAQTMKLVYGRLLGVIKGDVIGVAEHKFSKDTLRVQALTKEGELVGKPFQISVSLLNPFPRHSDIDTLWDLERFYGNIASSFETEIGSEIFDMALSGILDPSGEMGLNTLQVAIDLPEDFSHGWLTHFAYFGKPDLFRQGDPFALDTANAFDSHFLGEGAAYSLTHFFHWGGAGAVLIDQLARDTKYNTYEPGVREQVLAIFGHLLEFNQIDPANVQDPKLQERAKRLAYLGAQTQVMLINTMNSQTQYIQSPDDSYGRPLTLLDRAQAVFDVIEANRSGFNLHFERIMELLLNAGVPQPEWSNHPHPDCADRALDLYFSLIATGAFSDDDNYNQRLIAAGKSRRSFAAPALMPGLLNPDAAFTARTRATFLRVGYGSTEEVQAIVDALDISIPQKYMGEEFFDKNVSFAVPTFEFNEISAPVMPGTPQPVAHPDDSRFAVSFHTEAMADEVFLQHALSILKDIAFNLPEDSIGRSTKARIVENWRQIQLEELEKSLERQFRPLDGPPPELTPEQKYFKSQLTDEWQPVDNDVQS